MSNYLDDILSSGSGIAASLATTLAPVDIAASSPPTVGQSLVATSPSTAIWKDADATVGGDLGGTADAAKVVALTSSEDISYPIGELTEGEFLTILSGEIVSAPSGGGGVSYGAVAGLTVGGSNTNGVASTVSRSDHVHALAAFGTGAGTFTQGNDARLTDDRRAASLKTATTTVTIGSAVAPSVGMVLTAINSTSASWQAGNRLLQSATTNPPVNTLCKQTLAGSNITVNLPATHTAGDIVRVKMTSVAGGNTITIDPSGTQTIDGALTYQMVTDWECVTCESDGTNWLITG